MGKWCKVGCSGKWGGENISNLLPFLTNSSSNSATRFCFCNCIYHRYCCCCCCLLQGHFCYCFVNRVQQVVASGESHNISFRNHNQSIFSGDNLDKVVARDGHVPIFAGWVSNIKKNHIFLTKILWFWILIFYSWGWIKPKGMNNNNILGT